MHNSYITVKDCWTKTLPASLNVVFIPMGEEAYFT